MLAAVAYDGREYRKEIAMDDSNEFLPGIVLATDGMWTRREGEQGTVLRALKHGKPVVVRRVKDSLVRDLARRGATEELEQLFRLFRQERDVHAALAGNFLLDQLDAGEAEFHDVWPGVRVPYQGLEDVSQWIDLPLEPLTVLVGLLQAHHVFTARGYVHRDIKPANIVVVDGQVKLLDLGLAAPLQPKAGFIAVEHGVGTAVTMAPEMVGTGRARDERADLFSIGVVAFYLLTGSWPYPGLRRPDGSMDETAAAVLACMQSMPDVQFRSRLDSATEANLASKIGAENIPAFAAVIDGLLVKDVTLRTRRAIEPLEQLDEIKQLHALLGRQPSRLPFERSAADAATLPERLERLGSARPSRLFVALCARAEAEQGAPAPVLLQEAWQQGVVTTGADHICVQSWNALAATSGFAFLRDQYFLETLTGDDALRQASAFVARIRMCAQASDDAGVIASFAARPTLPLSELIEFFSAWRELGPGDATGHPAVYLGLARVARDAGQYAEAESMLAALDTNDALRAELAIYLRRTDALQQILALGEGLHTSALLSEYHVRAGKPFDVLAVTETLPKTGETDDRTWALANRLRALRVLHRHGMSQGSEGVEQTRQFRESIDGVLMTLSSMFPAGLGSYPLNILTSINLINADLGDVHAYEAAAAAQMRFTLIPVDEQYRRAEALYLIRKHQWDDPDATAKRTPAESEQLIKEMASASADMVSSGEALRDRKRLRTALTNRVEFLRIDSAARLVPQLEPGSDRLTVAMAEAELLIRSVHRLVERIDLGFAGEADDFELTKLNSLWCARDVESLLERVAYKQRILDAQARGEERAWPADGVRDLDTSTRGLMYALVHGATSAESAADPKVEARLILADIFLHLRSTRDADALFQRVGETFLLRYDADFVYGYWGIPGCRAEQTAFRFGAEVERGGSARSIRYLSQHEEPQDSRTLKEIVMRFARAEIYDPNASDLGSTASMTAMRGDVYLGRNLHAYGSDRGLIIIGLDARYAAVGERQKELLNLAAEELAVRLADWDADAIEERQRRLDFIGPVVDYLHDKKHDLIYIANDQRELRESFITRLGRVSSVDEAHSLRQSYQDAALSIEGKVEALMDDTASYVGRLRDDGQRSVYREDPVRAALDAQRTGRWYESYEQSGALSRGEYLPAKDLYGLCREVVTQLTSDLGKRKHLVMIDPDAKPDGLQDVVFDHEQVFSLLRNWIENASEAIGDGTNGSISVRLRRRGQFLRIGVRDSGPGMNLRTLRAAMEGVSSKPKGNGVGLSRSRARASNHFGRFGIRTAPGRGMYVFIDLPLGPPVLGLVASPVMVAQYEAPLVEEGIAVSVVPDHDTSWME